MTRNCRRHFLTAVLTVVAGGSVVAHLSPTKSVPDPDAVLTRSPDYVQVWFTQDPDPAISRLTLEGPAGDVVIGETTVTGGRSLRAAVPVRLAPGTYTLKWRTAGDDGHVQRGDISFRMRDPR